MAKDTYVGVQPYTGSGLQKIRNLEVTTIDPVTGLANTVEMQVVMIADVNGDIIRDFVDREWQQQMLDELRGIRRGIEELTQNPFLVEGK